MSEQDHVPFWKQLTRLLLGVLVAVGFGAFWVALIFGIGRFIWLFIGGIAAMALGVMHLVFLIQKHRRYRAWQNR